MKKKNIVFKVHLLKGYSIEFRQYENFRWWVLDLRQHNAPIVYLEKDVRGIELLEAPGHYVGRMMKKSYED